MFLVVQKYDFLSTGLGALVVTSYCYYRGQDLSTALSITLGSTILALVISELSDNDSSSYN